MTKTKPSKAPKPTTKAPSKETAKPAGHWSALLREAVNADVAAGESLLAISEAIGIKRTPLYEFAKGNRTITIENAEILASHYGFQLTRPAKKNFPKSGK